MIRLNFLKYFPSLGYSMIVVDYLRYFVEIFSHTLLSQRSKYMYNEFENLHVGDNKFNEDITN